MHFEIDRWKKPEELTSEEKLKKELNELFDTEAEELRDFASPYFLIINEGGIACVKYPEGYTFLLKEDWDLEKVDHLIKNKAIDSVITLEKTHGPVLMFDNFDSRFINANKHPQGIATYYELIQAGYEEKDISLILKEVLSKYDKLEKVLQTRTKDSILSTAIALTCRGTYQCPTSMKEFFKRAGGPSAVQRAGELIDEPLRYDSNERAKSYLHKIQKRVPEDSKITQKYLELWRRDEGKVGVTNSYIGGLIKCALELADYHWKLGDVGDLVPTSNSSVGKQSKKIARRQMNLVLDEIRNISVKDAKKLDSTWYVDPSDHALQKLRLRIVESLLKNRCYADNPVDRLKLHEEMEFPHEFYDAIGLSVLPTCLDFLCQENKGIYIKDKQGVENYILLTGKIVDYNNLRLISLSGTTLT